MTRQPYQPHASLDHSGFGDHLLHMSCAGAAATQDSSQSFPVQLHPRETNIGPIETQCHFGITHFFQDVRRQIYLKKGKGMAEKGSPHLLMTEEQKVICFRDKIISRTSIKSDLSDAGVSDIEKLLIAGAVPLAVDLVNEDPELLPFHNLRFIAYDAGDAESALPLKKMTQMREEGVVGFIGLDGSCEHEALLAAAWDMTMVSYVSTSNLFLS
ncbi:UNVERIFIED_CONTAM: Gyc32E [Trichonephila clavipes]